MATPKRIFVAVDFSDYSLGTLRYALDLARPLGGEVMVVNIINQRDVDAVKVAQRLVSELNADDYLAAQRRSRIDRLNELCAQAGAGEVKLTQEIRVGHPAAELLKAIVDLKADLVVMGTKGRTNLGNTLFGSVAEKVFRRSPVAVLSVRGKEHADLIQKLGA